MDTEHGWDCPELAHGQGGNCLVRTHGVAQTPEIDTTIALLEDISGDRIHTRVSGQISAGKLG